MNPMFNNRGQVTRDGLACGYVQRSREGVTLEKCLHGRGLLVRADGGHSRIYLGPSLADARRAFADASRLIRAFRASAWRTRGVWGSSGYWSRVELVEPDGRVSGPYESEHDARLAWASRTGEKDNG